MRRSSLGVLVVFTLVWWAITGLYSAFVLVRIARHLDAQRRFQETSATVLECRMLTTRGSKSSQYRPFVRYRYAVAGTFHIAERYSFDESSSSDTRLSRLVLKAFPAGKTVPVYYDPDHPATALLSLPVPNGLLAQLLFLQPFLGIGLLLLYALVTRPRAIRSWDRFLQSPASRPWEIPGWGCLDNSPSGWSLTPRPAGFLTACVAYPWVSLLGVVVVLVAGGGFSDPPRWLVLSGFGAAIAASLALGPRLDAAWRRSVAFDAGVGTLTVSSRKGSRSVPLAQIEALVVGTAQAPENPDRRPRRKSDRLKLVAVLQGGEAVELCDFMRVTWDAERVARKAGEEIARTLGRPFRPSAPS